MNDLPPVPPRDEAWYRAQARRLSRKSRANPAPPSHQEALDTLAREAGFTAWGALLAHLKGGSTAAATATPPPSPDPDEAQVHSLLPAAWPALPPGFRLLEISGSGVRGETPGGAFTLPVTVTDDDLQWIAQRLGRSRRVLPGSFTTVEGLDRHTPVSRLTFRMFPSLPGVSAALHARMSGLGEAERRCPLIAGPGAALIPWLRDHALRQARRGRRVAVIERHGAVVGDAPETLGLRGVSGGSAATGIHQLLGSIEPPEVLIVHDPEDQHDFEQLQRARAAGLQVTTSLRALRLEDLDFHPELRRQPPGLFTALALIGPDGTLTQTRRGGWPRAARAGAGLEQTG